MFIKDVLINLILINDYDFTQSIFLYFSLLYACCLFGNICYIKHRNKLFSYSLNMSSSGTESDSSASSDVDFDDYGEFG